MSLQDFTRDIVPILSLIIACFGLASVFLLYLQIRSASEWNKLKSQRTLVSENIFIILRRLHDSAKKAGIILKDRIDPLTDEEIEIIWNDEDSYYAMLIFLNELETTCTVIRSGIVDEDLAYSSHYVGITVNYEIYKKAIEKFRKLRNNNDIFIEWERVAIHWEDRRKKELEDIEKHQRKVQAKLAIVKKKRI